MLEMDASQFLRELDSFEQRIDAALEEWVLQSCEILNDAITVRKPGTAVATPKTTKKKGTSPHPGRLRSSWRWSTDVPSDDQPGLESFYPVPGAPEVRAGLSGFKVGDDVLAVNNQRYAPVIDDGRKPNKLGRMAGSDQNPEGILEPAAESARPEIEALEIKIK